MIVLLQMIDPYNNQKMTYSEIVHLLSSHMISASSGNEEDHQQHDSISQPGSTNFFGHISVLEKFVNIRTGGLYFENNSARPSISPPLVNQSKQQNVSGGGQEDIRMMILNMKQGEEEGGDYQQKHPPVQSRP